jgi:hypothetical protein
MVAFESLGTSPSVWTTVVDELFLLIRDVWYGYYTKEGVVRWQYNDEKFHQDYKFISPQDMLKCKAGICWNCVELARQMFTAVGMEVHVIYIELMNDFTHTYTVFVQDGKYYWFEYTFDKYRGVHGPYQSLAQTVQVVAYCMNLDDHRREPITYATDYQCPPFGITSHEFMDYARKGKPIDFMFSPEATYSVESLYTSPIIPEIKTPEDIMKVMDTITYGYMTKTGKPTLEIVEKDFYENYRLQTTDELWRSKIGVCWDQVELERKLFAQIGYECTTCYVELKRGDSHTFLVYHVGPKYYWFEHSYAAHRGIHGPFKLVNDVVDNVIMAMQEREGDNGERTVAYTTEYQTPQAGFSCAEFMKHARSGKHIMHRMD